MSKPIIPTTQLPNQSSAADLAYSLNYKFDESVHCPSDASEFEKKIHDIVSEIDSRATNPAYGGGIALRKFLEYGSQTIEGIYKGFFGDEEDSKSNKDLSSTLRKEAEKIYMEGDGKKIDHAIEIISHAISLNPEGEWLHFDKGHYLNAARRCDEAIIELTYEIENNSAQKAQELSHLERGMAYESLVVLQERQSRYFSMDERDKAVADFAELEKIAEDDSLVEYAKGKKEQLSSIGRTIKRMEENDLNEQEEKDIEGKFNYKHILRMLPLGLAALKIFLLSRLGQGDIFNPDKPEDFREEEEAKGAIKFQASGICMNISQKEAVKKYFLDLDSQNLDVFMKLKNEQDLKLFLEKSEIYKNATQDEKSDIDLQTLMMVSIKETRSLTEGNYKGRPQNFVYNNLLKEGVKPHNPLNQEKLDWGLQRYDNYMLAQINDFREREAKNNPKEVPETEKLTGISNPTSSQLKTNNKEIDSPGV